MGAFYGCKIRNKETNLKTGKLWSIEDVPNYWKEKTTEWLNVN